jgi:hypothetical protein
VLCPANIKWFDKPFDRLTVLSNVDGLTTLSQPVESLKVERVEGQIKMIKVSDFSVQVSIPGFKGSTFKGSEVR